MNIRFFTVLILGLFVPSFAMGASFFEIDVASDVSQSTNLHIDTDGTHLVAQLGSGSAFSMFIGSEMALDFNLKLNVEIGFHQGRYPIEEYSSGGIYDPLTNPTAVIMSVEPGSAYFNNMIMLGIRLKYDWQITESTSIEPYLIAGTTPVYQYSPTDVFHTQLDAGVPTWTDTSFTFTQDNVLALNYMGFGIDFDFNRAAVEYSGSSKWLLGFSVRNVHRAVYHRDDSEDTNVTFFCFSGTVLF